MKQEINTKKIVEYWRDLSDHDWETAQSLWQSKKYDACLFYCHLTLEKLLKGLVVHKTKKTAPHTHDLIELLEKTNIQTNKEQVKRLAIFTSFNMRCRYPQDKFAFYKLCTHKFSEQYFYEAKELILWLKKYYQKNK